VRSEIRESFYGIIWLNNGRLGWIPVGNGSQGKMYNSNTIPRKTLGDGDLMHKTFPLRFPYNSNAKKGEESWEMNIPERFIKKILLALEIRKNGTEFYIPHFLLHFFFN